MDEPIGRPSTPSYFSNRFSVIPADKSFNKMEYSNDFMLSNNTNSLNSYNFKDTEFDDTKQDKS